MLKRISGGSTISADTGFVFILSRKSICKATLWFPQVGVGGAHKKPQNKTGQMRHCSRGSLAAREHKSLELKLEVNQNVNTGTAICVIV